MIRKSAAGLMFGIVLPFCLLLTLGLSIAPVAVVFADTGYDYDAVARFYDDTGRSVSRSGGTTESAAVHLLGSEFGAVGSGAAVGVFLRLLPNCVAPNRPLSPGYSFSAATGVLMADGTTKAIADIELGDYVLAEDPETGERGPREVTKLWIRQDAIADLEPADGSRVSTTEDHPFWNATDAEWQRADALDPGDFALTAAGGLLAVGGMDWGSARTTTAYNLTVDDIHTYYVQVGGESVLVHDVCSAISRDSRLVKEASKLGSTQQRSVDALTSQLTNGNLNPGIGTKNVLGAIFEARARGGARVYFQNVDGVVTIVGKPTRSSRSRVASIRRELCG